MGRLLLFILCFTITFLCYYITVVMQEKKYDLYKKGSQVKFFERKYGLKFKNITIKKFFTLLSIIYAFIVGITLFIVSFVGGLLWKLLLSIAIMIPLLLLAYTILGKYIRKKEL